MGEGQRGHSEGQRMGPMSKRTDHNAHEIQTLITDAMGLIDEATARAEEDNAKRCVASLERAINELYRAASQAEIERKARAP